MDVPFSDMPANFSNWQLGVSRSYGECAQALLRPLRIPDLLHSSRRSTTQPILLQSPLSPQDNYNPAAERSNSLFDQRHRIVISGVYMSGSLGAGFINKLLSDWTVAPIVEVASGRPFNIITGIDQNFDFGPTTDRPIMASGPVTNSCGQTAVASRFSPTGWLIPACALDGQFLGNLGTQYGNSSVELVHGHAGGTPH